VGWDLSGVLAQLPGEILAQQRMGIQGSRKDEG
jgi:hypothetical protein